MEQGKENATEKSANDWSLVVGFFFVVWFFVFLFWW